MKSVRWPIWSLAAVLPTCFAMYRTPLLAFAALSVALSACGSSSKPPSATSRSTTTTQPGPSGPPTCSATAIEQNGTLVVTVTTDHVSAVYADDPKAKPTEAYGTLLHPPYVAHLVLNDPKIDPVTVSVFANRLKTTCAPTSG